MTHAADRRSGSPALLLLALLAGCAEPVATPEHVERLEPGRAALRAPLTSAGETRLATRERVPLDLELCSRAGGPGAVEVGALALVGQPAASRSERERATPRTARGAGSVPSDAPAPANGVELRLAAGNARRSAELRADAWTDLRVDLPRGAECATLELAGSAGAEVALSQPLLVAEGAPRPWVVLYVVDTLRFDATPYGDGAGEDGSWARLAGDAIVYRRALASSSWTRPSVATLLTGLGPSFHRVFDRQDRLAAGVPRLPAWLAAQGYATAAFSTNPNVLPAWGFLDGFDRFFDVDAELWSAGEDFARLADAVRDFTAAHADRPLFLYVHDNEPHFPYRPAARHRERLGAPAEGSPAEAPLDARDAVLVGEARALYTAEVAATAERLGGLLDALEGLGRYRDALIVVAGDHGEEFGEHGGLYHGRTLYQEQLHVPLVIKPPDGRAQPGAVDAAVSTEDVAPTLLDLLGLPLPVSIAEHRLPLPGLPAARAAPPMSELRLDGRALEAAFDWPLKYVREVGGAERLFDLEADPGERADLAASRPRRLAALAAVLDARRSAARAGLGVACVAGARHARVRVELEVDAETLPRVTGDGLETGDVAAARAGGVWAELALRPAESPPAPGELADTARLARGQPDRDGLRVLGLEPAGAALALSGVGSTRLSVEGPDGAPLAAGRIPVTALATATAPREPEAGEDARCRLHYLSASRDVAPAAALDPDLRERLRALGYLD